jgi:hypothetical protein
MRTTMMINNQYLKRRQAHSWPFALYTVLQGCLEVLFALVSCPHAFLDSILDLYLRVHALTIWLSSDGIILYILLPEVPSSP